MDSLVNNRKSKKKWTLIIKPVDSFSFIRVLSSIWKYRDLLFLFVKRDFVSQYKQTILGPLWFFIQPLLNTIIFTIIFGNFAKISTDGIPQILFYLSGITLWNYFSDCLSKCSETFITNTQLFSKVYFPRVVVPISIVISSLIKFSVQFLLFLICFLYFIEDIQPNIYILLTPILILITGGLGLGFGLIFSSLTTKYKDLRFLLQFGIQLMMYASPIVYPLSIIPDKYKLFILANPMTSVIELFKYSYTGFGSVDLSFLVYSSVAMLVILLIGILTFNSIEKSFIDTI